MGRFEMSVTINLRFVRSHEEEDVIPGTICYTFLLHLLLWLPRRLRP
jgi:hypothetical protein